MKIINKAENLENASESLAKINETLLMMHKMWLEYSNPKTSQQRRNEIEFGSSKDYDGQSMYGCVKGLAQMMKNDFELATAPFNIIERGYSFSYVFLALPGINHKWSNDEKDFFDSLFLTAFPIYNDAFHRSHAQKDYKEMYRTVIDKYPNEIVDTCRETIKNYTLERQVEARIA